MNLDALPPDSAKLLLAFQEDCVLRDMKFYRTQVYYVRNFLLHLKKDPLKVDRSDLKAYLSGLHGRGLKQTSIDKIFGGISNLYEFLTEENVIPANPVRPFRKRYIRFYKEQDTQDVRQLISVEAASRLVNSILDSRDKAIITLLLKTGMRANELLSLDVGDIDIKKMEIRLKPTTKRSNRLIFFDYEAERVLRSWLVARENRNIHGGDALFPSKTSPRLSIRGLEREVVKHAIRVGLHDPGSKRLEHRFSPHCCRHWFSTHLFRSGMEERYIAWLRGDVPRGAMGPYIHIDPEDVRRSYLACIPQLGV